MAYLTKPDPNQNSWPKGVPFIVGNEGCERFSYYGMNAILYVYLVSLYSTTALNEAHTADTATSIVHLFKTGVYAFPMIGAILADRLFGKYSTILWLSLVYCVGHLVLSLTEGTIWGLYLGLFLIAIGAGGIKPCVSAHVGDQFSRSNWHLIQKIYQVFYFIINFGSFFATLLIPLIKEWFGFRVAFALPGVLMFVATFVFWLGRNKFVHIPAKPSGKLGMLDSLSSTLLFMSAGSLFLTATQPLWLILLVSFSFLMLGLYVFGLRQKVAPDDGFLAVSLFAVKSALDSLVAKPMVALRVSSGASSNERSSLVKPTIASGLRAHFDAEAIEGAAAMMRIMSVFFLVSIFWALFDQHSTSWIRQASMMELNVNIPFFGAVAFLPSQIPSLNPVMVMMLIPILAYVVYPTIAKLGFNPTPLRRMTIGMALASLSFVAVAVIQVKIDVLAVSGHKVSVLWQLIPYILITLAEVFVSITGLEFAYTQAPLRMKSTIMGFWLLTTALGNVLVAFTARFAHLDLVDFFWFFAGLMGVAALLFGFRAATYQERDYSH